MANTDVEQLTRILHNEPSLPEKRKENYCRSVVITIIISLSRLTFDFMMCRLITHERLFSLLNHDLIALIVKIMSHMRIIQDEYCVEKVS